MTDLLQDEPVAGGFLFVERALNGRAKHNRAYSQQALERTIELIDLTGEVLELVG